ncbi:MAG TPA: cyclase family protein [Burkholderiales bacterium]|nr:cyclase family protein [Burkholderiales bacterium]
MALQRSSPFARSTRTGLALLAALSFLAGASPAVADDDGTEDLLRLIKKSRLVDLSHPWEIESPIAGVNPPYAFELTATHENTRGTFGDGGQLSFAGEVQHWSGQHGAPNIDAIGHIGRDGKLFGGLDAAASTSNPDGIGASGVGAQLAIDAFPTDLLVTRGVLLDVARMIQGDWRPLPDDFEVTAAHLEQAAKRQRVRLKRGDTVFIRTGWGQHFQGDPARYKGDFSPGPSLSGAEFLIKHGARIVGNDTLTFEKRPPLVFEPKFQVFPVHMRLITDSGIYIIENLNLEQLAKSGADEFVVVVPPLKVKGGTGSALRAFALVNEKRHGDRRDRDD